MDYIDQLVPTGEKNSVGYDIMTNVDDSYRRGIEIMGGVKISELIDWNLNLTLSQNKINNFTYWSSYYDADWSETYESRTMGETDIAYSPSIIGGSRLSYQIMKDFNLSLISKYVGKQYFDNLSSENREIKAYFINNIELDYSFSTKFIHEISLKFQLNNIANVKYANNAYGGVWHENGVEKTWAYYFPQAGIHFMTGISLKF
jgi:iron complex outermembrane receptor protein